MHASLPLLLALSSLALAQNRVFSAVGTKPCQACLAEVEAACKGPTSSAEFNNCFCDADGTAWDTLAKCVVNSDCLKNQYQILSYYGSHCFAYSDGSEAEFCIEASQQDKIKMSVVDLFCTEFITPSSTKPVSATTTQESGATAIASGASSTVESTAGATQVVGDQRLGTTVPDGASPTGDSSENQNDGNDDGDDDDDKDSAALSLSAVGTTGGVIVALWSCVMAIRIL